MKIMQSGWFAFLRGFMQALDFSGIFGEAMLRKELADTSEKGAAFLNMLNKKDFPSDTDAFIEDWRNIGGDFRNALLHRE